VDATTERILVGVDGSSGAVHALRWAHGLAARLEATLVVVLAYRHEEMVGPPGARWPVHTREVVAGEAHDDLTSALAEAIGDDTSVKVEAEVVYGQPARVLLDRAATADLLVVGSRGRGGFRGLLLGSVSQQCVTQAPCPVTVVPTPA
jgi:nucleotide-binding universal stress UspA family protein